MHPRSAQHGARFLVEAQYDGLPLPGDDLPRRRVLLATQTEELSELRVEQRSLAEYAALTTTGSSATLDEVLADVFPGEQG